MWFFDGVFDPIAGEVVAKALKRIEDELFQADWAEARERVGDRVSTSDLGRTQAQRRADALVQMARRAGAVPAGARLPEPLFSVLVGYETFAGPVCEMASGTVLTPGSLVPWLSEAWVERVVFDAPDRVTNVGVRRRAFAGATRRAVEVRDRECFSEFCDVPAEDCQIDHVEPWAAGGWTTDDKRSAGLRVSQSPQGTTTRRTAVGPIAGVTPKRPVAWTAPCPYKPRRSSDLGLRCQSGSTLTASSM
jgi:hypothetical protein